MNQLMHKARQQAAATQQNESPEVILGHICCSHICCSHICCCTRLMGPLKVTGSSTSTALYCSAEICGLQEQRKHSRECIRNPHSQCNRQQECLPISSSRMCQLQGEVKGKKSTDPYTIHLGESTVSQRTRSFPLDL